jgi:hypothetical protein
MSILFTPSILIIVWCIKAFRNQSRYSVPANNYYVPTYDEYGMVNPAATDPDLWALGVMDELDT